ncbi:MAG: zinc ribbon domain-containing protein [Thaumarchaeota archaeon]|nr:zinc ribbon domain-containing protein [Nitrososphaerota archaeon]
MAIWSAQWPGVRGLENLTVGTKINVGDVISKATNLLKANPSIILISVIPAVPSLLGDVLSSSSVFNPLSILTGIISAVLSIIAGGAYAPVVKEAIGGQRLTISEALGHAYRRFWSLLGAGILIVLIVILGSIALIVPGIIFATWYAYATPAIMLENKGATEGMSASKAFGRDKKWSTFSIFLIFFLAYIIVSIIGSVLSLGGGGRVIQTLLTIPLSAWTSVVIAYTYVTHGPSATPTEAPTAAWQQPSGGSGMSTGISTGVPLMEGPSHFCAFCGSPLKKDAKFCANCGKPV